MFHPGSTLGTRYLELCVARDGEDLIRKISRLYENTESYKQVQEIGYKEFKKRTADAVGDELYALLSTTIEKTPV
jgi:hypothetical protein